MKTPIRKTIQTVMAMALVISQASPAWALRSAQLSEVGLEEQLTNALRRFNTDGEPVNAALSVGGTKIAVGVIGTSGIYGDESNQPAFLTWDEVPDLIPEDDEQKRAIQALRQQVVAGLNRFEIADKRLNKVGISWAGEGDFETGVVRQTKIPGLNKFSNVKQLLEAELQSYFGRAIEVTIMHDGAAGAMGEHQFQQGMLYGHNDGMALIVGTGFAVGVIQNGKPVYSVPGKLKSFLGEIGWHLIRKPFGSIYYTGYGAKVGDAISDALPHEAVFARGDVKDGELRIEQRVAGPWAAARFVEETRALGFTDEALYGESITIGLDGYPNPKANTVSKSEQQTLVLKTVTELALGQGDAYARVDRKSEAQAAARRFIERIGTEIGEGLKTFLRVYADQPFAKGRIVLISSLGEKFGLGVAGRTGQDLFVSAIQTASGHSDVVRSQISHEREFSFMAPAAGQEEKLYRVPKAQQGSGPVGISAKVGGTEFHSTVADANGLWQGSDVIAQTLPTTTGSTQEQIFDHWAALIVQTAQSAAIAPDRIVQVHISWPGYFDDQGNLTQNQENIPGILRGVNMAKQLQDRVNRLLARHPLLGEIQVIGVHDGTGHALGELSRFGTFPGQKSMHLVGPGTGIANRTTDAEGNPFTGGPEVDRVANEAPNMLAWEPVRKDYQLVIFDTVGYPLSREYLANGSKNPYYGRQSMEDRTAGPGIARYVVELLRAGHTGSSEFLEHLLVPLANRVREGAGLEKDELDQIMRTTGDLVTRTTPNLTALTAVTERAYELGVGTAVTIVEYHRYYGQERYPYPAHIVLAGGVSTIGELYETNFKAGLRARLERYRTEKNAPADLPDPTELVNRVATSKIPDKDRELLGGLPTENQIAAHQKLLDSVQFIPQLRELAQLADRWNSPPVQPIADRRGLILDASTEPRVAHIAQALAVLIRQNNNPFGVEFRLVIPENQRQQVLDELRQVDSAAAPLLESRIVAYDANSVSDADEQARWTAMAQLSEIFGYDIVSNQMPADAYRIINRLTPQMAQELGAFFTAGGLQFLTSDAINRLEALFTSA